MYEGLKIVNMYTLSETIAEELLSSSHLSMEVLPKIGDFIRNLDQHCLKKNMSTEVKMCGLQRMRLYSHLRIFMDQRSSVKAQKSDIVHLSWQCHCR